MPTLYSYCIPFDDGAAPNPFFGVCTLVICKPAIRRTAEVGDWVVGTGSKNAVLGNKSTRDLSGRMIHAMKVTRKMTMAEYDTFTARELTGKVPDWTSPDIQRRVGDSLYDLSVGPPRQRPGVHLPKNMKRDLSGQHALLSSHFLYFGDLSIALPPDLRPIAQNQRSHRKQLNEPYLVRFEEWIHSLPFTPGTLIGKPLLDLFQGRGDRSWCADLRDQDDDEEDFVAKPDC